MNRTMMRGKWRQARGGVKVEWGRLTDNERRMIDGKIDQILGMLQERYGYTQERAIVALRHYLGLHAKKPSMRKANLPQTRLFFGLIFALTTVAIIGWVTFTKFFSAKQPMNHLEGEDVVAGTDHFEPEMMAYEGALD